MLKDSRMGGRLKARGIAACGLQGRPTMEEHFKRKHLYRLRSSVHVAVVAWAPWQTARVMYIFCIAVRGRSSIGTCIYCLQAIEGGPSRRLMLTHGRYGLVQCAPSLLRRV